MMEVRKLVARESNDILGMRVTLNGRSMDTQVGTDLYRLLTVKRNIFSENKQVTFGEDIFLVQDESKGRGCYVDEADGGDWGYVPDISGNVGIQEYFCDKLNDKERNISPFFDDILLGFLYMFACRLPRYSLKLKFNTGGVIHSCLVTCTELDVLYMRVSCRVSEDETTSDIVIDLSTDEKNQDVYSVVPYGMLDDKTQLSLMQYFGSFLFRVLSLRIDKSHLSELNLNNSDELDLQLRQVRRDLMQQGIEFY